MHHNKLSFIPIVFIAGSQKFLQTTQNLIGRFTCYDSYYRKLYSSMSHGHTSQHWTHLPRCEFIQLAMIGSGGLRRGKREEEMVRLAHLGRIETILHRKTSINLYNLFVPQPLVVLPPPPPSPRVILIEGAPGGGKSTLALHICHQWAQGASFLVQFDLVVLAYLRDQAIQNANTLADILPARSFRLSEMIASQIQDFNGENVMFIFDGWDEFPTHLQTNSLISTIIRQPHKLSLHQSTVLITSRPVSSGNLLHIADRRVEILGFTQHQIREYIEKALDGNSTHIQKLIQHLEEHPVIEGYCYVPLHVAILVHIFLTMKGALPTTLHKLFCNLVLCCIVRELDTHESENDTSEVRSLNDLPDDLKSKLSDLCVLAYEGVMQNKVVFYQDDLRKFNLPANLPSMGLLQAVEGLTLHSKSLSHNFLHLSVQELLTAYHISHIDSSKQRQVFASMFGSSRFQAVLHYYSGFTKLANPAIQDFVSTYARQKSSIEDLLPLLHCFYEAQEPSLCKLVFTRECIELNSPLNPVDYLAIGYFVTSLLSVPSSDTSNIVLKITNIVDKHRLKLLLLELSKYRIGESCERRLEITMQDENINKYSHQLFEGLQHNSALVHLNLSKTGLVATEDTAQALTTMLQVNNTLTHLNLSENRKFLKAYCVFQGLQYNTSLVHLNLSETGLVATEDTAQALVTMFQVNKSTLTHLDLSGNQTFLKAYCIFQALQHNTTLVHLNLSNTGLVATEDTVQALTTMLQVNKTIKHLDLSENFKFSDSGAYCVFRALQDNTSLIHLNLRNVDLIGKVDAAQALTTMLQVNKTLAHLDLSYNWTFSRANCAVFHGIQHNTALVHLKLICTGLVATEDTAQALTTMIQDNKTLTHLNLSENFTFSDSGAYCVFQGLQRNTTLIYLNLRNTGMTDKGAEYIAQAIESNCSLQTLNISKNRITDNGFACIEKFTGENTCTLIR